MSDNAALSAIVVSPGGCEAVAPLLRCLQAQTIRERIQIVFVAPKAADPPVNGFASWEDVPVGAIRSMAAARAEGVRAAAGPVVVFTEEHCFPEADWAEALVGAFNRHAADAVGPVFINANPRLSLSQAIFFQEYGQWMAPHPGGSVDHLPGHNSAYRREPLLALGDRLVEAIENEFALHSTWRAHGRRLRLEPAARVHHVNITSLRAVLISACAFQRPWAASRAQGWGWPRRLLYALSTPLIPILRLRRIFSRTRRDQGSFGEFARALPWLALSLTASAFGEFLGYAGSIGNAAAILVEVELYRRRYLASGDRGGLSYFQ